MSDTINNGIKSNVLIACCLLFYIVKQIREKKAAITIDGSFHNQGKTTWSFPDLDPTI